MFNVNRSIAGYLLLLASLLFLCACGDGGGGDGDGDGGGVTTYTVGGLVNGMTGTGLVLQNNGGDNLQIDDNGSFVFSTPMLDKAPYNATVFSQPGSPDETCLIANGTGAVDLADVTDIYVGCGPFCNDSSECEGAVAPVCDNTATCQGTRTDATCEDSQCGTTVVDDDSGCDSSVLAKDCVLYNNIYCTGDASQVEPICPTSCTDDSECKSGCECVDGDCMLIFIGG